jgi:hypothetical protein
VALLALVLLAWPAGARAQDQPPPIDGDSISGASLRVFLMTIGQGNYIFERFGHNAIWIRDERTGADMAWNYGIFDFDEPGYMGRLMRGSMLYRVESYDGNALTQHYVESNRTVIVQELNLAPSRKAGLRDFLVWNDQDAHRDYLYDYYRDNCSTRVRDALDRALDGQLRLALEVIATNETYRSHTQRLLADRIPAATGTHLGLGPAADVPLNAWETAFLPVQLMEQVRILRVSSPDGTVDPLVMGEATLFEADRQPEAEQAPQRFLLYLATGLVIGLLVWLLGRAGSRRRSAAIGFVAISFLIALAIGTFGTIITLFWAMTDHAVTYNNENLLQANPVSLIAAVLLVLAATGRARVAAAAAVLLVAGLSILGFALQVLPGLDQANGEIIALLLPIHLGIAAGLHGVGAKPSAG